MNITKAADASIQAVSPALSFGTGHLQGKKPQRCEQRNLRPVQGRVKQASIELDKASNVRSRSSRIGLWVLRSLHTVPTALRARYVDGRTRMGSPIIATAIRASGPLPA